MSYLVLILGLLIIAVVAYKLYEDYLSPTFITALVFAAIVVLAWVGVASWNYRSELSIMAICLILVGVIGFGAGEFFVRKTLFGKKESKRGKYVFKEIDLSRLKWIIGVVFVALTAVLLILEIERICEAFGYKPSGLGDMLWYYRRKTSVYSDEMMTGDMSINFVVSQMQKICMIIGAFSVFIFINNCFVRKIKKRNLIMPALLALFSISLTVFISGGRSFIMHYVIMVVFLVLFFYREKYSRISRKMVGTVAAILGASVVGFYLILPLFGRSTEHSFIDYTSFYFGVSVPTFDIYLENGRVDGMFGEETFLGVYDATEKFGLTERGRVEARYKWIDFGEIGSSNVYTGLRGYYNDFGMVGLVVLRMLAGAAVTIAYFVASGKGRDRKVLLIVFAYYCYVLVEQARGETFMSMISLNTVAFLVLFWLMGYLVFGPSERKEPVLLSRESQ